MIYALPAGTRVVFLRDSDAGDGRPAGWIRAGDLGTVVAADATQVLVRFDRHLEATAVCDPGEVQAYPPPLRCPACSYGDDHFDTAGGGIACGRCFTTIRAPTPQPAPDVK